MFPFVPGNRDLYIKKMALLFDQRNIAGGNA
jgi:hypothetical protein